MRVPRVSMKDIAERVGVDRSTVSLALKNDPRISEKTRQRIQDAAKELGYRPDPAFKILGAQRWKSRESSTGFVIAFITYPESGNDPEIERYRAGAKRRAEALGFSFSNFDIGEYPSIARANQVLVNRGVSGLLFAKPMRESDLEGYDWNKFSSITLGEGYFHPKNHTVEHNRGQNLHNLWNIALKRGAKRIGTALLKDEQAFEYMSYHGSLGFLQKGDPRPLPPFEVDRNKKTTTTISELQTWLSEHAPQVVIGYCDEVYDLLTQAGCRIPKDLSFVSLKKHSSKDPTIPDGKEISGIDLKLEQAGEIAISMLSSQILQNERDIPNTRLTHLVETEYIEGDTFRKKFR